MCSHLLTRSKSSCLGVAGGNLVNIVDHIVCRAAWQKFYWENKSGSDPNIATSRRVCWYFTCPCRECMDLPKMWQNVICLIFWCLPVARTIWVENVLGSTFLSLIPAHWGKNLKQRLEWFDVREVESFAKEKQHWKRHSNHQESKQQQLWHLLSWFKLCSLCFTFRLTINVSTATQLSIISF